jgi:hypothetical protein
MAEITNKLLREAIADAEAVRETAVANAKMVLEEAITPQIRDMIARRLRVESEGSVAPVRHESATEKPFEDADAEGSSQMPADSSTVGSGENKEPSDDAFDASDIGNGGENKEDSHTDWYDDWSESDFDLDEVIKELEEDIAALSEAEHDEEGEEKHDGEGKPGHEKKETGDEEHAEMKKEGEFAGHEDNDDADKEIDLDEILAELEAEEDEEELAPEKHSGQEEKKVMAAELARIKNDLAQYREAVNTLRERLQEVNLLNAKLLFTNKMFRKEGLNNEQKIRIVESFDRATTVREVKLVYTALVENLSTAAKTFAASRKKVVAEGLASKATPSTAPKAEVIVENTVAKRLQELAGIIS